VLDTRMHITAGLDDHEIRLSIRVSNKEHCQNSNIIVHYITLQDIGIAVGHLFRFRMKLGNGC
jgi:hypothetical protein